MKKTIFFMAMAALWLFKSAHAQNFPVSGTVKDKSGQPLPGATVTETGTTNSAQTTPSGTFSLKAKNQSGTLSVTYLGYRAINITFQSGTEPNITLQEDEAQLRAVEINTGYYSVSQRHHTGSISKVTAATIEKQPVSNPLLALQGRTTGAYVTQSSGTPGSSVSLLIRGQQSIDAGTQPLYLIDGIPFGSQSLSSSTSAATATFGPAGTSPFATLSPEDIQSIEILKDADATAIYGSRGANGVVLITTKSGKKGKTKIDINSYAGYNELGHKLKLLGTQDFLDLRRTALALDGLTTPRATDYDINGTWDQNAQTDWQEELLGRKAQLNSTSLSVSGGSDLATFYLSANHQSQGTITPGDHSYSRTSAHFSGSLSDQSGKFRANASVTYAADKTDWYNADLVVRALQLAPNAPSIYSPGGSLNWAGSSWVNPLRVFEYRYLGQNNTLSASAQLSYRPIKDLELSVRFGHSVSTLRDNGYTPASYYDPAQGATPEFSTSDFNHTTAKTYSLEPQASYNKAFKNSRLSLLIGLSLQRSQREQLLTRGTGFTSDALIENLQAAAAVAVRGQTSSDYKYLGSFFRIGYTLSGRYTINLTGRRDGSSRFSPENRYANFGAIGLSYLASETKFVREKLPFVSLLKIRSSYGSTGSDQIGDYEYLDSYQSVLGYNIIQGLSPARLYNPSFGWETTRKLEAAIEFGLFNDRIAGSIGYFRNRSDSQLIDYPLAATAGFTSIRSNLDALVQNSGLEAEVLAKVLKGKLGWETSFNLTVPRNRLISFPGLANSSYANQYVIGRPLSVGKTYELLGVNPTSGVYTFRDFDGDGAVSSPNDRQKLIERGIRSYGGLTNSFSYGNFDLSFLIQFVFQTSTSYRAQLTQAAGRTNNQPAADLFRYWQPGATDALLQRPTSGSHASAVSAATLYPLSDAATEDSSFARLKNLSLSYRTTKVIKNSTLRIYLQGQNLYTLTGYFGLDPESSALITPPLRTVTLGLQLSL